MWRITRVRRTFFVGLGVLVCVWIVLGWHAEMRDANVNVCRTPTGDWTSPNQTLRLSTLPKIIHQQVASFKDVPEHFTKWRAKLLKVFPESQGFKHVLWTDKSQREFLETHYGWFLPTYDSFHENIMRSDSFRVFVLYHFGGLYLDMDYEVLENFWDRLPDDAPSAVESPHAGEKFQNAFMASPAKHEFWKVYWGIILEKSSSPSPIDATGPRALDSAVTRFVDSRTRRFVMLPCTNWNRAPRGADLEHSRFLASFAQNFYVRFGFKKPCGSTLQRTCLAGIHHGVYSWAKIKI